MEHQGRDDDRGEADSFHRAWLHPLFPLKGTRRAADPTWRVIGIHRLITMRMLIAKAATFRSTYLSSCLVRAWSGGHASPWCGFPGQVPMNSPHQEQELKVSARKLLDFIQNLQHDSPRQSIHSP